MRRATRDGKYIVTATQVIGVNGKPLTPYLAKGTKYFVVNMYNKPMLLHRVLAMAHIPNPDKLATVDHINGNCLDNRLENLQWMSLEDNIKKSSAKTYIFKSPEGGCVEIHNLNAWAKERGLRPSHLYEVYSGKRKSCKGWTL